MNRYLLILLTMIPFTTIAAEAPIKLSDKTRALLIEEMNHVKTGMESLVFDIAAANWDNIASTGQRIKDSYILQQKLSKQQMHELHMALPEGFQALDHKFHYYAGMLAHAAKEHDMELVQFYRYKMNESCSVCHAAYATARFSNFSMGNKHEQHME